MSHRFLIALITAGALSLTTAAWGQQTTAHAGQKRAWTPPRTPDGHPDLDGTWNSASITPLERPVALANKAFYTPAEIEALQDPRLKDLNRDRRDGGANADLGRAYNEGWYDRGTQFGSNLRTSRVIDPPDGRIPPMTPAAQKRFKDNHAWFAAHPADNPEDRPLPDRCLIFSQSGPPFLPGNYNNNYQIVETPDYVAIMSEMPHQTRIIPVHEQPALPTDVRQWMGDSKGHWEGDKLVVETTNLRSNNQSRFGVQYDGMTDENLRITETFQRTAPDTIIYRATINDPTVYTKPWTIETPMTKTEEPIYEYACHEGNYGLADILAGARAEEKKAAEHSGGGSK